MTSPIIERAARAVYRSSGGLSRHVPWENLSEDEQDRYFYQARAVLRAIREPSEGMLIHGRAQLPEHDEPLQEDAENCWQAMIDAALGEGE